jgi:hypothetical protein
MREAARKLPERVVEAGELSRAIGVPINGLVRLLYMTAQLLRA